MPGGNILTRNLFRPKKKREHVKETVEDNSVDTHSAAPLNSVYSDSNDLPVPMHIQSMSASGHSAPVAGRRRQRMTLLNKTPAGGGGRGSVSSEPVVAMRQSRLHGVVQGNQADNGEGGRDDNSLSTTGFKKKRETTSLAKASITKFNLGMVYAKTKSYQKARMNFKAALQIRTKLNGMNSLEAAAVHEQLGKIERDEGNKAQAMEHYETALRMITWCELYGKDCVPSGEPDECSSKLEGFVDRVNDPPTSAKKALRNKPSELNIMEMKERIEERIEELENENLREDDQPSQRALLGYSDDQSHVPTIVTNPKESRHSTDSTVSELSMSTLSEKPKEECSVSNANQSASATLQHSNREQSMPIVSNKNLANDDLTGANGKRHKRVKLKLTNSLRSSDVTEQKEPGAHSVPRDRQLSSVEKLDNGMRQYELGQYSAAILWFHSYLETTKNAPEGEKPSEIDIATIVEKIANCEAKLGNSDEAHRQYQLALRTFRRKLGNKNEIVLRIIIAEGDLYCESADHGIALELYEESLSVAKEVLSEGHPDVLRMTHKIIGMHEALNAKAMGKEDYEEALFHRRQILGFIRFLRAHNEDKNFLLELDEISQLLQISQLQCEMAAYDSCIEGLSEAAGVIRCLKSRNVQRHDDAISKHLANMQRLRGFVFECTGKNGNAINQYELALPKMKHFGSAWDVSVAKILIRLGILYACRKEDEKAIASLEEALQALKHADAEVHWKEYVKVLDTMVVIYVRSGENEKAIECLENSLEVLLQGCGEEDEAVSSCQYRLGCLLGCNGEHERALSYLISALNTRIKLHGEVHEDVAASRQSLAAGYNSLGEQDKAVGEYRALLSVMRQINPNEVPRVYCLMGLIQTEQGEVQEAFISFSEALRSLKAEKIRNSTLEAEITINLGNASLGRKDYKKALVLYDNVLQLQKKHNMSSPFYRCALYSKGLVMLEEGSYTKAKDCFQEILDFLGNGSSDIRFVTSVLNSIARASFLDGNNLEAIAYYEKSLLILKRDSTVPTTSTAVLSGECPNHDLLVGTLRNVATTYFEAGMFKEAMDAFEDALQEQSLFHQDRDQRDLACALLWRLMGSCSFRMGKYSSAMKYYQLSLQNRKVLLGENHPDVLKVMHDIALAIAKSDETNSCDVGEGVASNGSSLNDAIEILDFVHTRLLSIFGEDHVEVAKIRFNMCGVCLKRGDLMKATELNESARATIDALDLPGTHACYKQARRWEFHIKRESEERQLGTAFVGHANSGQSWWSFIFDTKQPPDESYVVGEDYGYKEGKHEQSHVASGHQSTRSMQEGKLQQNSYSLPQRRTVSPAARRTRRSNKVTPAPAQIKDADGAMQAQSKAFLHRKSRGLVAGPLCSDDNTTMQSRAKDGCEATSSPNQRRTEQRRCPKPLGSRPSWITKGPSPVPSEEDAHRKMSPRSSVSSDTPPRVAPAAA